jgi:hypothetical protein
LRIRERSVGLWAVYFSLLFGVSLSRIDGTATVRSSLSRLSE